LWIVAATLIVVERLKSWKENRNSFSKWLWRGDLWVGLRKALSCLCLVVCAERFLFFAFRLVLLGSLVPFF
jgi:hypothetical protein